MDEILVNDLKVFERYSRHVLYFVGAALCVMVLGSVVRVHDAGLACPDWPLCFGKLVPSFDWGIFLEWFHRLVAGGLVLWFLGIAVWIFRTPLLRSALKYYLLLGALILGIQVVLGGLTVFRLLAPTVVSLHLVNAVLFVSMVLASRIRALQLTGRYNESAPHGNRLISVLSVLLTLFLFVQLFVGGMVSTSHAGLVCQSFPFCNESSEPLVYLQHLHMGHRYLAYLILVLSLVVSVIGQRALLSRRLRFSIRLIPWLITLQVVLGMINVWYALPPSSAILHHANALLLYLVSFHVTLSLWVLEFAPRRRVVRAEMRYAQVRSTT